MFRSRQVWHTVQQLTCSASADGSIRGGLGVLHDGLLNGSLVVAEPREWVLCGILQWEVEGKTQPKRVVFRKKRGRNIERKYQYVGGCSLTTQETTILYSGQNSPPTCYHCPKLLNPIFSNPAPSLIHLHSLHFQFFPLSLNFFTFHSTPPNTHCNTDPLQRFSESLASSSTTEALRKMSGRTLSVCQAFMSSFVSGCRR